MGLDRRAFLKFLAGASAGVMVTPVPWKLLDDVSIWTQNWSWIPRNIPGPSKFVRVVSKTCPSSTAMTIRLAGSRPVRALPDNAHPLGGGVTAIAASEVQMLYSPGRVSRPMMRSKDGAYVETTWANAAKLLHDKLVAAGTRVAFLSGDENGYTTEVISAFAAALGSDKVYLMPSEAQAAAVAVHAMGVNGRLGYDIEKSDCVLCIGANIFETFGPVVANRKAFFANRPHATKEPAEAAALVYAGPTQNNTATAGKWLPITPGSEGALALGIAAELVRRGRGVAASDFDSFRSLCASTPLAQTASHTGVSEAALKALVDQLEKAKAPLVITGSSSVGGAGAAPVVAGFAVNALLGNLNKPGGLQILPEMAPVLPGARPRMELFRNDFAKALLAENDTQVLVVHEANPLFALPDSAKVKAAYKKVPFKVSFASMMNETASESDLVLPIAMGIERADDVANPYGFPKFIYCTTGPATQPGEHVRETAGTLLFIAKQMGHALGNKTINSIIMAKASDLNATPDSLAEGTPVVTEQKVTVSTFSLRSGLLAAALAKDAPRGVSLAIGTRLGFGTPQTGIPPFAVKTVRGNELTGTEMHVAMNGKTAQTLGLAADDRVKVASGTASVSARVRVFEGVAPGVVAASFGFGHTAFDAFSQNKGENVMKLVSASAEPETGLSVWPQTIVKVTKA